MNDSILDVPGLAVGNHARIGEGWLSGTTVVVFDDGAVCSADVRGGGPGTRETDLLDPRNLVERVDAIVLSGGSAYGLDAAGGVMRALEARGSGFRVGAEPHEVVPIVPAAVVFDLGRGGDFRARPDAGFGACAVEASTSDRVERGNVGAGAGAVAGGLKGGLGSASEELATGRIGAVVVANAGGDVVDRVDGTLFGDPRRLRSPSPDDVERARGRLQAPGGLLANTTIGVVATDVALTKAEAQKLAGIAHDGLARAVRPAHTYFDGDTIFAASTGRVELDATGTARAEKLVALFEAGARCVARAIADAVVHAESVGGIPSYRELFPSAWEEM
jgi:L-aminopeptidase/D-esterase-like protein